MKTQTLEALMNQGFRKAQVQDNHALYKFYARLGEEYAEVYEIIDGEWTRVYNGLSKYIKTYLEVK